MNNRFEKVTPDVFREFLRELQSKHPVDWPNLYFAWEKPDNTLLMIGVKSPATSFDILLHEIDTNNWLNDIRASRGETLEYSTSFYRITSYMKNNKSFDPIECLVTKIAECKYLGFWEDPDVLIEDPMGYSKTFACCRFELAKEKIGIGKELDEVLKDAKTRAESDLHAKIKEKEFELNC